MFSNPTNSDSFSDPPDDELAALGQQLAADAAFLAERYPAPAPPGPGVELSPRGSGRRWRRAALTATAASLLVLTATATWREWSTVEPRPGERDADKPSTPLAHRSGPSAQPQPPAPPSETGPIDLLPTVSFEGLSGPEQEAVLDLLEENDLASNSLSI